MFSYLKKIKNSKGYYILVNFIFIRIYELIWVYIINFKGYLLYKEWNKKFASKKNLFYKIPQEINSTKFKRFSHNLLSQIDEKLILELKNKLINNEIYEDKNNVAANEKPFSVDLYPYLNFQTKQHIIKLALDEEIITSVGNYLKTFPVLAKVMVYLNIPRENSKERSSMHWHKDEFGYKSVDLFMSLCKIDDNNGPFYYSVDPNDTGATEIDPYPALTLLDYDIGIESIDSPVTGTLTENESVTVSITNFGAWLASEKIISEQDLKLVVDEKTIEDLALEAYEPEFGARTLRRILRRRIENPLATKYVLAPRPTIGVDQVAALPNRLIFA